MHRRASLLCAAARARLTPSVPCPCTVWETVKAPSGIKEVPQPEKLLVTLLPFQIEGLSWMIHQEEHSEFHGGILADEVSVACRCGGCGASVRNMIASTEPRPHRPPTHPRWAWARPSRPLRSSSRARGLPGSPPWSCAPLLRCFRCAAADEHGAQPGVPLRTFCSPGVLIFSFFWPANAVEGRAAGQDQARLAEDFSLPRRQPHARGL